MNYGRDPEPMNSPRRGGDPEIKIDPRVLERAHEKDSGHDGLGN